MWGGIIIGTVGFCSAVWLVAIWFSFN